MVLPIKEILSNKESQKQVKQAVIAINDCLQGRSTRVDRRTIIAAYTLYKVRISETPFSVTYQDLLADKLAIDSDIMEIVLEKNWDELAKLLPQYAADIFGAIVFLPINESGDSAVLPTPDSIIKLAQAILQCRSEDRIADIGCGMGTFIAATALIEPQAKYVGYEIDAQAVKVSRMRADLLGADIQILQQDAFTIPDELGKVEKFDKIFANYPFRLRLREFSDGAKQYLQRLMAKGTSSDWVFNALLCDMLKDDGKAIGIMTNGSTWNSIDTPMRNYFVERGLVECVIALPSKLFSTTNIPSSLIVLSRGNRSVRLIDAADICQQGRRQNEFSAENIRTIINALTTDSAYSKVIGLEALRENEYNLSLSSYGEAGAAIENGVPFEMIIKSITRGAPCTAQQLDEMVSEGATNMQYLMLSNIKEGMIEDNLPYLTDIDPKYEKYCLKNNSLILSKNGYPYKIAVAIVKEGHKILANGNLYSIEVDEEKANPYYLKAFLESDCGKTALKRISVGTTIPNIGVDKLKKLLIPLPPLEEQDKIAQSYQETLDQIADLKRQLEEAVSRLQHTFDAASEEQQASSAV